MKKKEFISGFAIEKMVAKHLDIEEEWIVSIDISLNGIRVTYDSPSDDND